MRVFEKPVKYDECSLHAAGHDKCVVPFVCDTDLYGVFSVSSGSGKIKCNNVEMEIGKEDIFICFPHEKMEISGDFEYDAAFVSVNSNRYGEGLGCVRINCMIGETRVFKNEHVSDTLKNLSQELSSQEGTFSNELVSLLCSQLVVYILRAFDVKTSERKADDANYKVCSQVMSYIDSRVYTMKNLREVAFAMGYNYSYISTLFHKTTGMTLNGYFKEKRMNEAKKLLSDNNISISEIARIMNYSSVYAFSKAFKEYFGSSPGHYCGRFTK